MDLQDKAILWTFEDGPTKGKRFRHLVGRDGTVHYGEEGKPAGRAKGKVEPCGDGVIALSYLARSGHTLTAVLDLRSGRVVAFASNERDHVVQHGAFTVADGLEDEAGAAGTGGVRSRTRRPPPHPAH